MYSLRAFPSDPFQTFRGVGACTCYKANAHGNSNVMSSHHEVNGWIGARLKRKEDARFLSGNGQFIADIRLPGMQDIAFVRSQAAHSRLQRVVKPAGAERSVFTLADLGRINVLDAGPELTQLRLSPYPPLRSERVA